MTWGCGKAVPGCGGDSGWKIAWGGCVVALRDGPGAPTLVAGGTTGAAPLGGGGPRGGYTVNNSNNNPHQNVTNQETETDSSRNCATKPTLSIELGWGWRSHVDPWPLGHNPGDNWAWGWCDTLHDRIRHVSLTLAGVTLGSTLSKILLS